MPDQTIRPHVALADDDEFVQVQLEGQLSPEYSVSAYSDGNALIEGIRQHRPAVILLDLNMQGLDGLKTCELLRSDEETRDIPVLFISGHDDALSRVRAYEAGADDFLVKPVTGDELRAKMRVTMRRVEQRHDLGARSSQAQQAAFAAMLSMGEMGAVMEFMRSTFACTSMEDLLDRIENYYGQAGLAGGARLVGSDGTASRLIGNVAPLTRSVLEGAKDSGRIFEFRNRLVINYPGCTLLVSNLPIGDPERCGRIRDNFALLAEASEIRLAAIEAQLRLTGVSQEAEAAAAVADQTAQRYMQEARHYREEVITLLESQATEIERAFVHLGLTENQESTLIDIIKLTGEHIISAAEPLQNFERDFQKVITRLAAINRMTESSGAHG